MEDEPDPGVEGDEGQDEGEEGFGGCEDGEDEPVGEPGGEECRVRGEEGFVGCEDGEEDCEDDAAGLAGLMRAGGDKGRGERATSYTTRFGKMSNMVFRILPKGTTMKVSTRNAKASRWYR